MVSSIRESVSQSELVRHTESISQWVRLSGTPDERKAFEYIREQLEGFGYTVTLYESDALIGYPETSKLEIVGAESREIHSNGYALSPRTDEEGVVGDVVYVGAGTASDYTDRDVRGKIVLSDGLAMPEKALAAQQAGTIGQIHINDEYIHEMCISPVWGTPTPETAHLLPTVPAVSVTQKDGEALKASLESGPMQMRLFTQPVRDWRKIPTLIAELPDHQNDEFVLFSGHVDSWHYGAMDNGTANATQLEVARILAENKDSLQRGIRIAFWSGHSHGRYASSAWYADTFWHDLHEHCVCHVNIDSVGAIGAEVLEEAPTMAETLDFAQDILHHTTGVDLSYRRISRSSDQSFWMHGIPSIFGSLSEQAVTSTPSSKAQARLLGGGGRGGGLGWWWHTTEDLMDKIDPENLERDARVYAETLWRLLAQKRLPFNFSRAADEMADTIDRFDNASEGLVNLDQTAALARDLAASLRGLQLDQHDAEAANQLQFELGRLLVPVNYTRSGPFDQDLALSTGPVPGLSEAAHLAHLSKSDDEFYFLRTRLIRERNRVEHALRTSLKLVQKHGEPAS